MIFIVHRASHIVRYELGGEILSHAIYGRAVKDSMRYNYITAMRCDILLLYYIDTTTVDIHEGTGSLLHACIRKRWHAPVTLDDSSSTSESVVSS